MEAIRRQTTQPVAWFWDLFKRDLLDLDPPYQRRSVWAPSYKSYFIDTVLLSYPAPAIFLFEEISEEGVGRYSVVDGKQRLQTIFEFIGDKFPVDEKGSVSRLRDKYFSDFPPEDKKRFYSYQFSIEFLPSTDEGTLNNIFDRINRNVSKLSPQELRHAKYGGVFASAAEVLAEEMFKEPPKDFPRIVDSSKRQMKDVELVVQLLLLTERGVDTQSQNDLDQAYGERDDEWEQADEVQQQFREVVRIIKRWADPLVAGEARRLRNQADYYSLYGAVLNLYRSSDLPNDSVAVQRLNGFMALVNDEDKRESREATKRYYEAARAASNDLAQRRRRIEILQDVILGGNDNGST
jgi:Protein of unknown function DUF262